MRVLVTGAGGFIGKAVCAAAAARGHAVRGMVREGVHANPEHIVGTLASAPWAAIESFAPDAVVHLAWTAKPGEYLQSPENQRLFQDSQEFLARCLALGVQHVCAAGTCIEYAPSKEPLHERDSPLVPVYPYSKAKVALFEWLRDSIAGEHRRWTWLRIFYPYGPGEHPDRLTSYLIRRLAARQPVELRMPESVKDFIYIDDVVSAVCCVLESTVCGAINVGTGTGVSIQHLALQVARLVGVDADLVRQAAELHDDPMSVVIADCRLLRSIGWSPSIDLDTGLKRLIDSLPTAT